MKFFKFTGLFLAFGLTAQNALASLPFDTKAKYAYLIDFDTGYVMFDKNGKEPMSPSSMSKLMTTYLIFEKLKNGGLSEEDEFQVSTNAWRKGGAKSGSSTMFLNPNTKVKVKDLLRGIIVQSGNDACIVAAENISGSEEQFAEEMTIRGKELGLKNSSFKNATGIPEKGHEMTAEDLAFLSSLIIRNFPEYYPLYSEKSFTYNKIKQGNRNPILYSMPGADGIKTGHTKQAGYGLAASVKDKETGRRLIAILNGLPSMKARSEEAKSLLNWGFREFDNYKLLSEGKKVDTLPVWLGQEEAIEAVTDKEILITMPRKYRNEIKAVVSYDGPIAAPVKKGQKIATLTITVPNDAAYVYDLVAEKDIEKVGYFGKLLFALKRLFSF